MSVLRRPDEAAVEQPVSASRRSVLAAAAGGAAALAALAANAVARPLTARAANGDAVTVGGTFTGTSPTSITNSAGDGIVAKNTSTGASGLFAHATATSGTTYGAFCRSDSDSGTGIAGISTSSTGNTRGVEGEAQSDDGYGVQGINSAAGPGVRGASIYGIGVVADSTASIGATGYSVESVGIWGYSALSTGIIGSTGAVMPGPRAKTGVYGRATEDSGARGVWGYSTRGRGVYGQATAGQGVRGYAKTGAALYGSTSGPMKGYALRAVGRVKFDKCAGTATIAAGTKSVTVTPGIDLVSGSAVVATLQGSAGGTTTVHRCAVNATANTFTIYLTANSTANVKVAWHVFG